MGRKTPALDRHNLKFRHHLRVRRRPHAREVFLARTIAAQIHGWAAALSFSGILALIFLPGQQSTGKIVVALVFGFSCLALFGSSALMHFLTDGFRISRRLEDLLETVDKLCIYLLIAGTYTAVLYNGLSEPIRTYAMVSVWGLAGVGSLYTAFYDQMPEGLKSRFVSTGLYLAMGWVGIFCIKELVAGLSTAQVVLTFLGGITYSVGAVIYALKKPNISPRFGYHELWHALVALGCLTFVLVVALSM